MPGRGYFFLFITMFSLLMGGAFATSSLLITSNLISTKQIQQKSLIEQLAISNLNDDAKLLSKQLKSAMEFEFLTIKDTDNHVLYRYIKDDKQLPLLTKILKHYDLFTPVQRVKTAPGNLVIEFQPSYELILRPMSLITLISFIAPISLCLFVFVLTGAIMDRRLEKVTKHLEALTQSQAPESKNTLTKSQIKPFQQLISNITLLKETPAQNDDPYTDQLTGLATGLAFVSDFNKTLQSLNFNAGSTPVFVMFRAIELQQLNLNQGYQVGDKYILDLAKHLQSYVSSKGASLYKLNGLDFGAIIRDTQQATTIATEVQQLLLQQLEKQHASLTINTVVIKLQQSSQLESLLAQADREANLTP